MPATCIYTNTWRSKNATFSSLTLSSTTLNHPITSQTPLLTFFSLGCMPDDSDTTSIVPQVQINRKSGQAVDPYKDDEQQRNDAKCDGAYSAICMHPVSFLPIMHAHIHICACLLIIKCVENRLCVDLCGLSCLVLLFVSVICLFHSCMRPCIHFACPPTYHIYVSLPSPRRCLLWSASIVY